jgi:hypothetical protein
MVDFWTWTKKRNIQEKPGVSYNAESKKWLKIMICETYTGVNWKSFQWQVEKKRKKAIKYSTIALNCKAKYKRNIH